MVERAEQLLRGGAELRRAVRGRVRRRCRRTRAAAGRRPVVIVTAGMPARDERALLVQREGERRDRAAGRRSRRGCGARARLLGDPGDRRRDEASRSASAACRRRSRAPACPAPAIASRLITATMCLRKRRGLQEVQRRRARRRRRRRSRGRRSVRARGDRRGALRQRLRVGAGELDQRCGAARVVVRARARRRCRRDAPSRRSSPATCPGTTRGDVPQRAPRPSPGTRCFHVETRVLRP